MFRMCSTSLTSCNVAVELTRRQRFENATSEIGKRNVRFVNRQLLLIGYRSTNLEKSDTVTPFMPFS